MFTYWGHRVKVTGVKNVSTCRFWVVRVWLKHSLVILLLEVHHGKDLCLRQVDEWYHKKTQILSAQFLPLKIDYSCTYIIYLPTVIFPGLGPIFFLSRVHTKLASLCMCAAAWFKLLILLSITVIVTVNKKYSLTVTVAVNKTFQLQLQLKLWRLFSYS